MNVAFTLPPGAYATLVVKRLFHWTLEPRRGAARGRPRAAPEPAAPSRRRWEAPLPPPPAPPAEPRGFLARRRAEKAARKGRRDAAKKGAEAVATRPGTARRTERSTERAVFSRLPPHRL